MTKNNDTLDIFKFLKGAGIDGYNKIPFLIVKPYDAQSFEDVKTEIYKNKINYISEIDVFINLVDFIFKHKLYKIIRFYAYSFFTESYKKEFCNKKVKEGIEYYENKKAFGDLKKWNFFINYIGNNKIKNDQDIKTLFYVLQKTCNFKVINYPLTNSLGTQRFVSVDFLHKNINFFDFIKNGKFNISFVNKNIEFSSDNYPSTKYEFNRRSFDGDGNNFTTSMTDIEKVCTLITFFIGSEHSHSLNAKKETTSDGKIAIINKKGLNGVINSIAHKVNFFFQKQKQDEFVPILFSDILNYFKDENNKEKIFNDLFIGSLIKNKIQLNTILSDWGYSISLDHNELKVVNLIRDHIKHIKVTDDTNSETLMHMYSIYGWSYLKGVDTNFRVLSKFDYFFFNLLYANIYVDYTEEYKQRPITGNSLIDRCINDVNLYFRKKENHFSRKQEYFKKFDGTIKSLVEYRNKVSGKFAIDNSLITDTISSLQLKKTVFANFFTF